MYMPASFAARSVAAVIAVSLLAPVTGEERDRSKIPDRYKWNLSDIYPDIAAWRASKEHVSAEIPKIRTFQGMLASSPTVLADALDLESRLDKELSRIYVY